MLKNLGFKRLIILSVITLLTAILLVSNIISYNIIKSKTIEDVNLLSTSIVSYEANKIENWFTEKTKALNVINQKYKSNSLGDDYVTIARLVKETNGFGGVFFAFYGFSLRISTVGEMTGMSWEVLGRMKVFRKTVKNVKV